MKPSFLPLVIFALLLAWSCSDRAGGGDDSDECEDGSLDCSCAVGQRCDAGLSCVNRRCVEGSGGTGSGGSAGSGGAGGGPPTGCTACRADQVCTEGSCADLPESCPCPLGSYCNLSDNRCVVGCVTAEHCSPGWVCATSERRCVCETDAVCGPRNICDGANCVSGCRADTACAAGEICEDLSCRPGCREDAECGAGRICEETTCVTGCRMDEDCGGQICENQACRDGCRTDLACGAGRICEQLSCRDGCRAPAGCLQGQTCLDLVCVAGCRTATDCGVSGASCISGQCVCPNGLTSCGGACVDPMSDGRHCGRCGNSCGGGTCQVGDCVCPAGQTCGDGCALRRWDRCTGNAECCAVEGFECVNSICTERCSTPAECAMAGATCTDGQCQCPFMFIACGGECVDPQTDERHCGDCGYTCERTCIYGICP